MIDVKCDKEELKKVEEKVINIFDKVKEKEKQNKIYRGIRNINIGYSIGKIALPFVLAVSLLCGVVQWREGRNIPKITGVLDTKNEIFMAIVFFDSFCFYSEAVLERMNVYGNWNVKDILSEHDFHKCKEDIAEQIEICKENEKHLNDKRKKGAKKIKLYKGNESHLDIKIKTKDYNNSSKKF